MKKSIIPVTLLVTLVLLIGIGSVLQVAQAANAAEPEAIVSLTAEELAMYNGKDGKPAYVAISGKVYDVTSVPAWSGGIHQGAYEAGKDLTDIIAGAPHGTTVLENLPVVAMLLTGEDMDIPTQTFTAAELAAYTGRDGNPAYIAVDGIVYDVSASPLWADGEHAGAYQAGYDYSGQIRSESPHGISVLENMPVVGRLVFDADESVK